MEANKILNYQKVLENIKKDKKKDKENHLLIGNGFNRGLGVNTSYEEIFQKMITNNRGIYSDARTMVEECEFDLEKFIGKQEENVNPNNSFLKKYVRNKIKFDFMQSTHEIVKSNIKNIYAEKNEGVFLLLKNYFSLNYDSLLYLLSLKYKSSEKEKEDTTIIFQPSLKFIEHGLNAKQNGIYTEIKNARKNGKLKAFFDNKNNSLEKDFNSLTKTHFVALVKAYSRTYKKHWKEKEIDRVVREILENEQKQKNKTLKVDDGCRQLNFFGEGSEYVFDTDNRTQNLFFLHGAFHIYKNGKSIKKITQQSDKALYERLEEILNDEDQEIVCVFQSGNKENIINNNAYLKNCLKKLGEISGNLVIIGSSLADNDNHIFDKINNSTISTIYISVLPKERDKMMEIAKSKFSEKDVYLFDAETISYEMPNKKESNKLDT